MDTGRISAGLSFHEPVYRRKVTQPVFPPRKKMTCMGKRPEQGFSISFSAELTCSRKDHGPFPVFGKEYP